jgi:hypothetical protein
VSDYVTVDFVADADTLTSDALESLRAAIPGWEPADGNLEVWLLAAHARISAEVATVASSVPTAVFRAFGERVIGLPPLDGVAATAQSMWVARDSAGYTIPAGTQVGYRVSGDTMIVFATAVEASIGAGATTISPVALTAVSVGVGANGVPAGLLEAIDALSWLDTVTTITVSSGGVDAELDDTYLARLAAELQLMAPRPILPDDFAVLARRVDGVTRALAVDGYDPGRNEVEQVAITGAPTGGSFVLAYSGQTTGAITVPATASDVSAALVALSNIAPGDVTVTGGPLPGTPVTVEFTGTLALTDVAQMTHADSLTGGTAPAVAVSTTTGGVVPSTGNERMLCVFPIDSAGAACSAGIRSTVQAYLDGLREINFVVHSAVPTLTTVNVTYTVHVLAGFDPTPVLAACDAALTGWLSPAVWAGGGESPPVWRTGENKVRYLAATAVLSAVAGVGYVIALTLGGGTSDVTLTGTAPLPAVGTITGTAA